MIETEKEKKLKSIVTPEGIFFLSPELYGYEGEPKMIKEKLAKLEKLLGKNTDEKIKLLFEIVTELNTENQKLQKGVDLNSKKIRDEIEKLHGWVR